MSLGEVLLRALEDTLMGMGTVFIILIIICLVISLFKFIPDGSRKKEARETPDASAAPLAPSAVSDEEENEDEIIAVILAAIKMAREEEAAAFGQGEMVPADDSAYIVRSIRRRR